jgi:hypothetical protein
MFKNLFRSFCALGLTIAAQAHALPIVDADAFTAGDNKAIYDASSGLIWMDLDVAAGKTYDQVISELNGQYSGWRVPTELEVIQLWSSLFSSLGWIPDSYGPNTGSGRDISDLSVQVMDIFGTIFFFQSTGNYYSAYSKGVFEGDDGKYRSAYINYDNYGSASNPSIVSTAAIIPVESLELESIYSVLLVKHTVPEPSPAVLLLLGITGLLISKRHPNRQV